MKVIGGLLLALGSAALINTGFLLQHRALQGAGALGGAARLRWSLRQRGWLVGQAIGWIGFGAQVVAVAIAPLSLVQAFAAGGLALSVPLASAGFGLQMRLRQGLAVLAIAAGLTALPLGLHVTHDRLSTVTLIAVAGPWSLTGLGFAVSTRAWARAIAAGCFYGAADAAIKAVSLRFGAHGVAAAVSPWTAVAAVATFAGFLCLQSALQADPRAVTSISLMTALSAIVALTCGLSAFGESLGAGAAVQLGHLAAIAAVLGCVPVLAAAQATIAHAPATSLPRADRQRRAEPERDRLHQRAEARRA
ncbi:MAG: hypothetical protein ACRDL5_16345 [Solirubrobacteraceae bacterium]